MIDFLQVNSVIINILKNLFLIDLIREFGRFCLKIMKEIGIYAGYIYIMKCKKE